MRRRMIPVSTALALMLSVAGCKDKAPEETMPETTAATTMEAVNVTTEDITTATPATEESTSTPVVTTEASVTETGTGSTTASEKSQEETPVSPGTLTILRQPQDAYVTPGSGTSITADSYTRFTIEATSEKPISYLWEYRMNENDAWKPSSHGGATSKTLSVYVSTHTDWDDVQFRCVVSEPDGAQIYSEPATLHINIPLTSDYFPDEAFCSFLKRVYDKDNDNYLSSSEREDTWRMFIMDGVSDIHGNAIENLSISNLEGLAYFHELEELYVRSVGLTELDISHNPKLVYLECNDNQLTSLNLNANLMYLYCSDNQLTDLNITGCTKLRRLMCVNNNLSKIVYPASLDPLAFEELFIDADVEGPSEISRRFTTPPNEDGWYYSDAGFSRQTLWVDEASYETALIEDGYLTIYGCLGSEFGYPDSLSGDIYDCGTIKLPLARDIKCQYENISGKIVEFPVEQFNDFDIDDEELQAYEKERDLDPDGYINSMMIEKLEIHLSNGQVDVIVINVNVYP